MKNTVLTTAAVLVAIALPALAASGKMGASKSSKATASTAAAPAAPAKAKSQTPEKVPAKQGAAKKLASDLTSTQESKLLGFLNEASVKELAVVKGISTTRGAAIEKARPFKSVDEVILVAGVGEGTFAELIKHGKTLTRSRSASSSSAGSKSDNKS
ncbi:MAG: helix-hairpin-helix domain-containing protein [Verrucomicrobiae bacterium]|nr:helix-hairpin-helix domain-containing protein [Verrucomicrobiae bacterium]